MICKCSGWIKINYKKQFLRLLTLQTRTLHEKCPNTLLIQIRVISGPCFPVFGLNTEICSVSLRIQSEYKKIRTRNNSVFGPISSSGADATSEFANIKEDDDKLKCISDGKFWKGSLWFMANAAKNISAYRRMKQ